MSQTDHWQEDIFKAMTTRCSICLWGKAARGADDLLRTAKQQVLALEKKWNYYDENSWLTRAINNRRSHRVPVSEEDAQLLQHVRELSQQTRGIFDVTIGTISAKTRLVKHRAQAQEIHEQHVQWMGSCAWQIEQKSKHQWQVEFPFSQTRLDLGGVIKEYAVDWVAKFLHQKGIRSAIIDFGGDIAAIGSKPDGSPFRVGIINPMQPESIMCSVDLKNTCLTTSGHYARSRTLQDGEISHVLDVRQISHDETVSEKRVWRQASVFAPSTLDAGIFSTALLLDDIPLPQQLVALLVDQKGDVWRAENSRLYRI